MKRFLHVLLIAVAAWLGFIAPVASAAVVTTGIIQKVDREHGGLTVISDQTHAPMMFHDLDKTVIQQAQGALGTFGDLQEGMLVTITYVQRDGLQYVSKVQYMNPPPSVTPAGTNPAAPQVPTTSGGTAVSGATSTVVNPNGSTSVAPQSGAGREMKPPANPTGGGQPDPVPASGNTPQRNRAGRNAPAR